MHEEGRHIAERVLEGWGLGSDQRQWYMYASMHEIRPLLET